MSQKDRVYTNTPGRLQMDIYTESGYGIARLRIKDSDNNYNYIIWCTETKECAVIDPIDPISILNFIRDNGLMVKYVINTHCHPDHISGNDPILKVSLSLISKALIHPLGEELIGTRYETVNEGDVISVGNLEIKVMHTPGHCPEHISLILGNNVFVGDTLFLSGCGNTHHRGVVEDLYQSVSRLRELPDDYRVFVGHDYAGANLRFALDIEPQNKDTAKKLDDTTKAAAEGREAPPTTIGEERTYNPFMRYDVTEVIEELKKRNPEQKADPASVFKGLRELRNEWA